MFKVLSSFTKYSLGNDKLKMTYFGSNKYKKIIINNFSYNKDPI